MQQAQQVKNKEKAIAICRDMLATLELRSYVSGIYGAVKLPKTALVDITDLQQLIPQIEGRCDVCIKGSLLLSKAKLFDDVPMTDIGQNGRYFRPDGDRADEVNTMLSFYPGVIDKQLADIFDQLTLDMMENAFEGCYIHDDPARYDVMGELTPLNDDGSDVTDTQIKAVLAGAVNFNKRGPHRATDRVRAVIENIMKNDGIFIVEPDYAA